MRWLQIKICLKEAQEFLFRLCDKQSHHNFTLIRAHSQVWLVSDCSPVPLPCSPSCFLPTAKYTCVTGPKTSHMSLPAEPHWAGPCVGKVVQGTLRQGKPWLSSETASTWTHNVLKHKLLLVPTKTSNLLKVFLCSATFLKSAQPVTAQNTNRLTFCFL